MKTIIFGDIPLDIKTRHDATRSGINGGYVFYVTAVQGLLRHSGYERFIFLSRRERERFSFADSEEFKRCTRNISIVNPTQVSDLADLEDAILVTTTERMAPLLGLRELLSGYQPPAAAFLSAANPSWFGRFLLPMVLAGASESDALVCASRASQNVAQSLMSLLGSSSCFNHGTLQCAVQTPLIPEAVDCSEFQEPRDESRRGFGFAAEEVVLLFVGRFEMYGKCDLGPLLLAFSRLRHCTRYPIRLVLAGADSDKVTGSIKQFAAELGCCEAVVVHPDPAHAEKVRLLRAADIFVLPGDGVAESFGLAPVEAMASGLPCVISDWDGYRDTVVHGRTGFLVPTMWTELGPCVDAFDHFGLDAVSTLAATTVLHNEALEYYLRLLIDSPDLRRQMGIAARRYALAHFDWPVVVREYDRLFDSLCEQRRHRSDAGVRTRSWRSEASLQNWFNSYPTRSLEADEPISITDGGRQWLTSPCRLGVGNADPDLIDHDLCVQIARASMAVQAADLGSLVEMSAAITERPAWLVHVNTMRLIKYGILSCQRNMSKIPAHMATQADCGIART